MRLVACFLPQRSEFSSRFVYLGFLVSKVVPRQVFSGYIGFPCQFSFHQTLRCPSNGTIMVKLPKNSFSLQSKNENVTELIAYYGTRKFITLVTKARHWSLSWAKWIQFTPCHHIYFRHTYSDIPSDIFTSGFPTKILYALITSACVFYTLRPPKWIRPTQFNSVAVVMLCGSYSEGNRFGSSRVPTKMMYCGLFLFH